MLGSLDDSSPCPVGMEGGFLRPTRRPPTLFESLHETIRPFIGSFFEEPNHQLGNRQTAFRFGCGTELHDHRLGWFPRIPSPSEEPLFSLCLKYS